MQNVQQLLLGVSDVAKLQLGNRPLIRMIFPIALSSNANAWRPTRRRRCTRSSTWSYRRCCTRTSRSAWSRARCCRRSYRATWRCRRRRGTTCRCCWTSSRRRGWRWRRSASSRCPVKPEYLIRSACHGDAGCFLEPMSDTHQSRRRDFARLRPDSIAQCDPSKSTRRWEETSCWPGSRPNMSLRSGLPCWASQP